MRQESVVIQGKTYQFVSEFREVDNIREAFYQLPKKTFKIDFKPWYEASCWQSQYDPHCLMDEGKVVSNVGVYHQKFIWNGEEKHLIQLGGVATDKEYRGRGLSRYLIETIIKQYKDQCDAIFLFGNDRVVDFYPRFGFEKAAEQRVYTYVENNHKDYKVRILDAASHEDRELVRKKSNHPHGSEILAVTENANLLMLYWLVCEEVDLYYIESLDTIAAASYLEGSLVIHDVYGEASLDEVTLALVKEERTKVIFGFTPQLKGGYEVESYHEKDTTLFIYGKELKKNFESEKLRFPVMSHT